MANKYPVTPVTTLKPGQMQCFEIADKRIIIAYIDDQYFAFDEMCSHEEAELWRGALRKDHIECPLHGSRFCLRTGKPLEEPATDAINTYPVEVSDDMIHVTLES